VIVDVLEHSDEEVDEQYVGHQQVAGHDGRDDPGPGLTGRQGHHRPIVHGDVLPTGGCTPPQNKHTHKLIEGKRRSRDVKPSRTFL